MKIEVEALVSVTAGELFCPPGVSAPHSIDGAAIDSRHVAEGQMFVAVVAERDGHDFVSAAAHLGAPLALVSRVVTAEVAQLVVDDTVGALGLAGRVARSRIAAPVIGVTGSAGKTSTKDLLASILTCAGSVAASERSLNNEMGVPLTLLNASEGVARAVVEMGARGEGHIAYLCEIAKPTIAVVTNVAGAHLELFGSIEAVARAKGELVESLDADGIAVLNNADPNVASMAGRCVGSVIGYSAIARVPAEVTAENVSLDADLFPQFTLASPWGRIELRLSVRGLHNVSNALAAAAAALSTGATLEQVANGCANTSLSPWRMELHRTSEGGFVLNDAYNANPSSMRAGLDALGSLEVRKRLALLGPMAELGENSEQEHRAIAEYAAARGIEICSVGTTLYGTDGFESVDDVIESLTAPAEGVAVLLKASRVAGLERIADAWVAGR
jgi:UDP-N-acetylmuramoyl-tripeptide--D-alanyl-D-alanine ligase